MRWLPIAKATWKRVLAAALAAVVVSTAILQAEEPPAGWRPVSSERSSAEGVAEQRPGWLLASGAGLSLVGSSETWQRVRLTAGEWAKRFELGARFLRGNSDEEFVNMAGVFARKQERVASKIDWNGRFGQAQGQRTANRWYVDSTWDYSQQAAWLLFVTGKHEYDELQGLNYRGTASVGGGYRFVDEEDRHVIVRLGPAVTSEYFAGGSGNRRTVDLFSEFEIHWPMFERTRLETKTTMRPSVLDLDIFRLRNDTGLLVALDENQRWSLKLGFLLNYNSQPATDRLPMDVTTNVSVVYAHD